MIEKEIIIFIINELDTIGFLNVCPNDEYSPEINKIYNDVYSKKRRCRLCWY